MSHTVQRKKIGLFFGAGAEISYGLPSGGRFAIDVFRNSPEQQKSRLKALLSNIDRRTQYAATYLPKDFHRKRINVFGKPDFTSLLQSSIEYRRRQVLEFLTNFDKHAVAALRRLGISNDVFSGCYTNLTKKTFGESNYQSAIRLNERLGDEENLFSSQYFSALLDVLTASPESRLLKRCLTSFLQLLVGCCSQKLAAELNEQIFAEAPDELTIFDDIGGIFQIEFSQAGLVALEIILENSGCCIGENTPFGDTAGHVSRAILECLFEECLNYQSLIDSHFRCLYDPRASWAKFTKICIFLNVVRDYILQGLPNEVELREKRDGYYHDLERLEDYQLSISSIGTTNYNNLLKTIWAGDAPDVYHLNGSVLDFYDPFLNRIVSLDDPEGGHARQDHVLVPLLFTQSGIKPLTSIEMSRRYVELFDKYRESDAVVVIGFGFHGDDGHINCLFRELIGAGKDVYICAYAPEGFDESACRQDYRRKLKLESDPANLKLIPVNQDRQTPDGFLWYEAVAQLDVPT